MTEFYESLAHSFGANGQAYMQPPLPNILNRLLTSPLTHEWLKLLVKLIYETKLVKYLHWGNNGSDKTSSFRF